MFFWIFFFLDTSTSNNLLYKEMSGFHWPLTVQSYTGNSLEAHLRLYRSAIYSCTHLFILDTVYTVISQKYSETSNFPYVSCIKL